jgi:hypothetical protein
MSEMIRESLLFMGVAVAIASGASFALAGCGCSDTNDKKAATVSDAVSLPEDVTPVSAPGDATAVSAPDAVSGTGD